MSGERHRRVRRRCRVEPAEVPFNDLQPAPFVAGQRTERDVLTNLGQVGDDRPMGPIGPAMGIPRLIQPPGPQERDHERREDRSGLLGAVEVAVQQWFGDRDRIGIPPDLG